MSSTFGERLRASLMIAGMTGITLGQRCNRPESTVEKWLVLETADGITGEELALAGLALGVSMRWLAVGMGSPVPIGIKKSRAEHAERIRLKPPAPQKRQDVTPRE